jgi:hypothetical protein
VERILEEHPWVIPDSQPLMDKPPASPPVSNREVYPRVQFRVGKKDWKKIETLAENLTGLKSRLMT